MLDPGRTRQGGHNDRNKKVVLAPRQAHQVMYPGQPLGGWVGGGPGTQAIGGRRVVGGEWRVVGGSIGGFDPPQTSAAETAAVSQGRQAGQMPDGVAVEDFAGGLEGNRC